MESDDVVQRINAHDLAAFEEFIRNNDRLVRFIVVRHLEGYMSYGMAKQEAEDIVQEIYKDLWTRGVGEIRENFRSWMRGVANNKAIDRRNKLRLDIVVPIGLRENVIPSNQPDPEAQAAASERSAKLKEKISKLRPLDQQILTMKINGVSGEEIAKALGMSIGKVKARYFRLMKKLRDDYNSDESED
jgi:RNA polymerase sigma factor (sigma-70 family)